MQTNSLSNASVLLLGLVFGLKHAIEADHVAAVTAIVSDRKSILSSSLGGGLSGHRTHAHLVRRGVSRRP